jgi:hypothetical protein
VREFTDAELDEAMYAFSRDDEEGEGENGDSSSVHDDDNAEGAGGAD